MSRIQVMPDTLASQVAAGEVVERPASVVKELVENSLDAGAKAIDVEIQQGGVRLIRVRDDGGGMTRDEALLAFRRHATSKLKTAADLERVSHLGFRGEALPSIASVARVTLATSESGAMSGTEVKMEGGKLLDVRDAGLARGTQIEVADLFFNVPARRKFLKAETTEAAHVEQQVRLHALAYPQVRFTFRKDGRVIYDLPATADLRVRVAGFLGHELGRELIPVKEHIRHRIAVQGLLLPGKHARRGRRHQCVFLNGRPIEDHAISSALREAYRGLLSEGLQPTVFLVLAMDPAEVDVNVHPAKREVRFRHPHRVREAVLEAVSQALNPASESASSMPPQAAPKPAFLRPAERQEQFSGEHSSSSEANLPARESSLPTQAAAASAGKFQVPEPEESARASTEFTAPDPVTDEGAAKLRACPNWLYLATLHGRYLLFEGEEGLVMMDPQAARERIWYERLSRGHEEAALLSQGLLVPELLELDARDLDLALAHQSFFEEAGIQIESFGGNTLKVAALPALLKVPDVRKFITDLLDELVESLGSRRGKTMAFQPFAAQTARAMALAEGSAVHDPEALLQALFACELPYCASDGRPSLIQLSMNELKRRFG